MWWLTLSPLGTDKVACAATHSLSPLPIPPPPCVQIQESATVHGENDPRWGQKFDFVMIPAGSTLYFIVYQKCLEGVPMLRKRKVSALRHSPLSTPPN